MSVAEKFLSMEYGPAAEDPREARVWLDEHGRKRGHFIGGSFRPPAEGVYFDTLGPSTGEPLAAVAQGAAADIDSAGESGPRAGGAREGGVPAPPGPPPYSPGLEGRKSIRAALGVA